ncbi:MAG: hypothetical protein HY744_26115 [Deltaproteobacteria bacterium]|nr:hypothetical protein [Deltaproteobacteria bacterium]
MGEPEHDGSDNAEPAPDGEGPGPESPAPTPAAAASPEDWELDLPGEPPPPRPARAAAAERKPAVPTPAAKPPPDDLRAAPAGQQPEPDGDLPPASDEAQPPAEADAGLAARASGAARPRRSRGEREPAPRRRPRELDPLAQACLLALGLALATPVVGDDGATLLQAWLGAYGWLIYGVMAAALFFGLVRVGFVALGWGSWGLGLASLGLVLWLALLALMIAAVGAGSRLASSLRPLMPVLAPVATALVLGGLSAAGVRRLLELMGEPKRRWLRAVLVLFASSAGFALAVYVAAPVLAFRPAPRPEAAGPDAGTDGAGAVSLKAIGLALSPDRSCALRPDRTVSCWPGDSIVAAWTVEGFANVTSLAIADGEGCATHSDGALRCWRAQGNYEIAGIEKAQQVVVGAAHGCALDAQGAVWCWGEGKSGQLGQGLREDSTNPVKVIGLFPAVQLAAGERFTCARFTQGAASCWGDNFQRQLGYESKLGSIMANADHNIVEQLGRCTQIAAGARHACALREDGTVMCWGDNREGQLGGSSAAARPFVVDGLSKVTAIAAGGDATCALTGGRLLCWGKLQKSVRPKPEPATELRGIAQVAITADKEGGRACAILRSKDVRCVELLW